MKIIFYLITLFASTFCYSQEKAHEDEIIYVKIHTLEEVIYTTNLMQFYLSKDKNENRLAKETVEQLWRDMVSNCDALISKFPNSEYFFETLYTKASIEQALGNINIAKEFYEKVLNFETTKTALKNKSLRALAFLIIEEKDFTKALNYLDQIKNYKVYYDCGVPYLGDKKSLEIMYMKCYDGLNKKQ